MVGVEKGMPMPGKFCPLDAPDDFFRIRLICTIIECVGHCFDRGASRRKLDFFLTFFQYYIQTKDPLPMDMEFLVEDTYQAVRPNWKLLTTLEEAGKAFQEAVAKQYKTPERGAEPQQEEEDEHELSDDEIPDIENDHHEDSHGSEGEEGSESVSISRSLLTLGGKLMYYRMRVMLVERNQIRRTTRIATWLNAPWNNEIPKPTPNLIASLPSL